MPEKSKKVFDVAPPQPPGATILQIEARKRVVIDDVQDKNMMSGSVAGTQQSVVKPIEADPLQPAVQTDPDEPDTVVPDSAQVVDDSGQSSLGPESTTTDIIPAPELISQHDESSFRPEDEELQHMPTEQRLASPGTVSDAIPDVSQKLTAVAEANMQQPKVFDTNEYFVPIEETVHKHGHVRESLIFGSILAIVVVVAMIFVLSR